MRLRYIWILTALIGLGIMQFLDLNGESMRYYIAGTWLGCMLIGIGEIIDAIKEQTKVLKSKT
jgi:hypothetical protein